MQEDVSVREMTIDDIELIVGYWKESDPEFLVSMGVDLSKIPSGEVLKSALQEQLFAAYESKKSYALIWMINGAAAGHSNVNKIIYGEEASMHLHIWKNVHRRKGLGLKLIRLSLPFFFKHLKLKRLYVEPYALNPAPNRALEKAGFSFVKKYTTVPGSINFEQEVMRWEMGVEEFRERFSV